MKKYEIGLYEKAMRNTLTWKEKLQCAKECGYDYLEISIDATEEKINRIYMDTEEKREIMEAIFDTGIPIGSMSVSALTKYALGDPDQAVRDRGMEIAEKSIQLSSALGVRTVMIPGYDIYYGESTIETKRYFLENIRKIAEIAEREGILVGFETMENNFMNTTGKAVQYVNMVDSAYLKIYPDAGNITNGLVTFTWGNVSEIDRETGLFAIKPSGVPYEELKPEDMVLMDLEGNKIEGKYNPSSDTATHIELYKAFEEIGGIVHTHSSYATSWAQAGRDIPCYGTTHADYIYGEVPCLRCLTEQEIEDAYEKNTGLLIVSEFQKMKKDVLAVPAVLCKNHGPFSWGKDGMEAVHNAVVLEECAKMAFRTELIQPKVKPAPQALQDKHYYRKHGANAYYGQTK